MVVSKQYQWLMPHELACTDDTEFTQLTTFIAGGTSMGGKQMQSCRGVNSPLGGDCNTTIHPRWDYEEYGRLQRIVQTMP